MSFFMGFQRLDSLKILVQRDLKPARLVCNTINYHTGIGYGDHSNNGCGFSTLSPTAL